MLLTAKKVFVFPNFSTREESSNPYIRNFVISLESEGYEVINKLRYNIGILSYFQNFFIKNQIINWPENIASRRFGVFQSYIYLILFFSFSILKKNRILIFHNFRPHSKKKFKLAQLILNWTIKKANLVVTHTLEGKKYLQTLGIKNIHYFPHPPYENIIFEEKCQFDILIWGNIQPYKKIDNFLELVLDNESLKNLKIKIVGVCKSEEYKKSLIDIAQNLKNVSLEFRMIPEVELSGYLSRSKTILFYHSEMTAVSSGSLIYSLDSPARIIGPNLGHFKEFGEMNLIEVFEDNSHLIEILIKPEKVKNSEAWLEYCKKYSWKEFSKSLKEYIK